MPRAKDELQVMAGSLGFEVHYSPHKIWVNRAILGGRFSKCFIDYDRGDESLRKHVAEWLERWAPSFGAFDPPVVKERSRAPSYSMGFKESK